MINVLDFGSQYSHLIVRRIRELGVHAELVPHNTPLAQLKKSDGIILSGGPQNLSDKSALRVNRAIFNLGVPILGICYGLQLIAYELGGMVRASGKREYGPTDVTLTKTTGIFAGLAPAQKTWMSHGDQVVRLPKGFIQTAKSKNCLNVAIAHQSKAIYGIQFHPEVAHTTNGQKILRKFVSITKAKKSWSMKGFVKNSIEQIKKQVGLDQVICALSGGVDSAVAATLVHKAIGNNLTCLYVDTGLMRQGETTQIIKTFRDHKKIKLKVIKAENEFLKALAGVTDPEKKRKTIGELFIRIFEREARKIYPSPGLRLPSPARREGNNVTSTKWLVQGTLYTDAISSGVSIGKTAAVIKSHHNVGGLPKKLGFKLIEPLRELYKDEVRKVGKILGLPEEITQRQPFPGPGLAVRIIGAVTKEKLDLLRSADAIVREEIKNAKLPTIQQYFAVLPDIRSVGVQCDALTYGHPIIVRAIDTADYMTAHWSKIPYNVLEKISVRITNEVKGINRVAYDITSKPPGTVEWE